MIFALFVPFFFTSPASGKEYERAYEIYEERLCFLTPSPFICSKCLKMNQRFVQILRFDEEGRPERIYACREWKRPYLE